jgi:hypothetical protein
VSGGKEKRREGVGMGWDGMRGLHHLLVTANNFSRRNGMNCDKTFVLKSFSPLQASAKLVVIE